MGEPRAWAQNYAKHKFTLVERSQKTSCCSLLIRRCYGSSAVFDSVQRGPCPYIPPSNALMLGTNDLLQRTPTGSRLRLLRCARNFILSPNRSQSCSNYFYPTSPQICDSSLHLKLVAWCQSIGRSSPMNRKRISGNNCCKAHCRKKSR